MSSTTRSPRDHRRQGSSATPSGRQRRVGDVTAALAGFGLGVVVIAEVRDVQFGSAAQILTFTGRVTGLVGAYAMVLSLFLVARIPILEREVGLDRLVQWHRKLAPYSLLLIVVHVVTIVLGYSALEGNSWATEVISLVTETRWILPAAAGTGLLLLAGITSYRRVRRRMAYETWWVIHLYTYLAVVLAFAHQVTLGNAFLGQPLAANAWLALTAAAVGSLVVFRWAMPVIYGLRHQMRVHAVVQESPGTYSVWMSGRSMHQLSAAGGQFFCWRFLTRELWWHAHPYSLSAPPHGDYLRITVKDLGDHSRALASIAPGTRVLAEGPYGAFTADRRHGDRVVLVAGGVGITPVRAILEELPPTAHVDVLYRARSHDEVVLRRELDTLAERPHTTVHYLVGSRREHPMDARSLLRLAPYVASSDIYICGPQSLTEHVRAAAEVLGVPDSHIHDEAFAF